jgi:hypothetical protein
MDAEPPWNAHQSDARIAASGGSRHQDRDPHERQKHQGPPQTDLTYASPKWVRSGLEHNQALALPAPVFRNDP